MNLSLLDLKSTTHPLNLLQWERDICWGDDAPDPASSRVPASRQSLNSQLAAGDWVANVMWNDYSRPSSDYTRVIWDVNDPNISFDWTAEDGGEACDDQSVQQQQACHDDGGAIMPISTSQKLLSLRAFNIANDDHYHSILNRAGLGGGSNYIRPEHLFVLHASVAMDLNPAFYRTCWNDASWNSGSRVRLHTEHLQVGATQKLRLLRSVEVPTSDTQQQVRLPSNMVGIEQLRVRDSGIHLVEYLERDPLLRAQFGMSSRFITYYKRKNADDVSVPASMLSDNGEVMVIDSGDPEGSPFLMAELRPGTSVGAMVNNLFVAPVVRHVAARPEMLTQQTSGATSLRELGCVFLLIRTLPQTSQRGQWTLRALPPCFSVGQLEPKVVVPPPPPKAKAVALMQRIMRGVIFRQLLQASRVHLDRLHNMFGEEQESAVRRVLREFCDSDRDGQIWSWSKAKPKLTTEIAHQACAPEHLCIYEAMLAAQARLRQLGIAHFNEPVAFAEELHSLIPHLPRQPWIAWIEQQLQVMPWHLTQGFQHYCRENVGSILLNGRGNPFPVNHGFSYIPTKNVNRKKKEETELPAELQEVKKKTGTDADLRQLTMEQLEEKLVSFGMNPEEIKPIRRWERTRIISRLSGEASKNRNRLECHRFVRHKTQTLQSQQEEMKAEATQIFYNQLRMLGSTGRPNYTNEVADDPIQESKKQSRSVLGASREVVSKYLSDAAIDRLMEERSYNTMMDSLRNAAEDGGTTKRKSPPHGTTRKRMQRVLRFETHQLSPHGTMMRKVMVIRDEKLLKLYMQDEQDGGHRLRLALGLERPGAHSDEDDDAAAAAL